MVALFAQQSNIVEFPQKSNEWYTPARYVEAAREVMGGIDLDPASCKEANMVVRAEKFYTQAENGLDQSWYGRVWLNPPYSRDNSQPNGKKSNIRKWVEKLLSEYQGGNVSQATVLLTTQTDNSWFHPLWECPICFADHSVRFYVPHGRFSRTDPTKAGRKTDSHQFGTIFVYFGKNEQKFIDIFSQFGTVARRVSAPKVHPVNLGLWEVQ